jgi:hypothetical protein
MDQVRISDHLGAAGRIPRDAAWRAAGADVDDRLGACFWLGGEQTVLEPNKLTPAGADALIGSVLDPLDLD